ncbi:MAG: hypothetical protein OEW39_01555 [Deltaproteobacteria bacterium]|nr:hypothetical protein [Deltaproteobacteria bacterium]
MKNFVQTLLLLTLFAGLALGLASCQKEADPDLVSAQEYSASLTNLGVEKGELRGRILFPHEYTQRSAVFTLNGNTFVTLPDGRFRIKGVPAGEITLEIIEKGYDPLTLRVAVQPGTITTMTPQRLVMARGRVLGRMIDEKGRSAEGITVRLIPSGKRVVTDKDGIFQFMAVPEGRHILTLDDKVFFMANRRVDLNRDEARNMGNIEIFRQQTSQSRAVGQRTP